MLRFTFFPCRIPVQLRQYANELFAFPLCPGSRQRSSFPRGDEQRGVDGVAAGARSPSHGARLDARRHRGPDQTMQATGRIE